MLEIVLTRDDANSDSALLVEWLAADREVVRKGQAVCAVETSKASFDLEAPGDGTLIWLARAGDEVEIGASVALVAESDAELADVAATAESIVPAVATSAPTPAGERSVTRKAAELAERYGIDLDLIEKSGFITVDDIEAFRAAAQDTSGDDDVVLAGLSTENVTLPAVFAVDEQEGVVDPTFLSTLAADPAAFGALPSEQKLDAYRTHGASVGNDVTLGAGAVIVAPRIVLGNGVTIGDGSSIRCHEIFAAGELALLGASFRLTCRRAFIGAGTWTGDRILIGGGGAGDPWATFVIGDLGFIGDEAFINVCRPVLIGREAFVTMRSVLLTHNVGHSLLEGFENRFAGIVLEDRAQIGVGAVVYAGCRVGFESIIASNSYVVSDIKPRSLAIGVPARVTGAASRAPERSRQAALAREMMRELRQFIVLRGVETEDLDDQGLEGFAVTGAEGPARILFSERLDATSVQAGGGETVVLTLAADGDPPAGCAVLDLLGRRIHGEGGVALASVREFCRKRGIRFEPGPWRYRDGFL